jgi:uncharacterized protein (DUF2344 family)
MSANRALDQRLAAAERPSDAPDSVPELNAAQYVILAESQRKKRVLAETKVKNNALVVENKRLLDERVESEKAAYEVRTQADWSREGRR